jgi:flagellar hook-length control protein FliK
MNEPMIDNLFSAAAPRSDVGTAALGRRSDDPNEFGDHLRQAGATAAEPSSEPWWRSAPEPRDSDQRPPERSYQPPDSNQQPPRPPLEPTSRPPAESNADRNPSPPSNREDDPRRYDSEQASATVGVAANQTPAQPAPDKTRSERAATSESPHGAHGSGDRSAKPKPDSSAAAKGAAKPTTAGEKATASEKDAAATRRDSTSSKKQSAAQSAASKPTAESADGKSATAKPAAKPAKADANAKPAEQTTTTTAAAATIAAAANDAPTTAAGKPADSDDSRSSKVSKERGAATQNQPAQAIGQKGLFAKKQSAADQATAGAAKPGDTAADPAVAKIAAKDGENTDTKKKDPTSTEDKSTADHGAQATPARVSTNQPTPNVTAITSTTTIEATVKDNASEAGAKVAKATSTPKSSALAAFGRLNRDGLLTARGPGQADETADAPQIDPARFVSRVARAIETAQDRGGPLSLRLSPPELGSMRLELSVKQGVMTAKVETDTAAARQALLDNLPKLRDRLAEQNVRIDRFDVDVRREGNGEQANSGPQQRQFQQHQPFFQTQPNRPTTAPSLGAPDTAADPIAAIRTITDTSINLVA